jgi:cell division transport system ATP-binding protein
LIELIILSKLYNRGVYALRDLSLTIDKGEFLFLTGPSGAGKSTLLRLLLREELPSEGDLKVAGRNLQQLTPSQVQSYRRSVGFVFQDFRLIPRFTVFQNVAFVMRVLGVDLAVQQRKTFQVLKWVGLQHRMNAYPEELSGGEQQRIAIARALVNEPQLVLADEPTGNLDPDLSLEIMNLFREINARGTTVVVATHDRELIRRVRPADHHARAGPDGGGRLMRALHTRSTKRSSACGAAAARERFPSRPSRRAVRTRGIPHGHVESGAPWRRVGSVG